MMLPPVFLLLNIPAVTDIVGYDTVNGLSILRIFRHGSAPQDSGRPYITWFEVAGQPYDQISGPPAGDFDQVQIDCWSTNPTQVETLATAVRDAIDAAGFSNRLILDSRDSDTQLYHMALEADFIRSR
jgi:hypothetical protein